MVKNITEEDLEIIKENSRTLFLNRYFLYLAILFSVFLTSSIELVKIMPEVNSLDIVELSVLLGLFFIWLISLILFIVETKKMNNAQKIYDEIYKIVKIKKQKELK